MKKIIYIILAEIVLFSFAYYLSVNRQYISGITADEGGSFVIVMDTGSGDNWKDVLFYDSKE